MFKTIKELKDFVEWSRKQKIKKIKIDNVELEMSELSFVSDVEMESINKDIKKIEAEYKEMNLDSTKTFSDLDKQKKIDEDEDLFYSS